jgi:hypothetical protein
MTEREARAAMGKVVTVKRSGAEWRGEITAIMPRPCLIMERVDGVRQAVALDGSEIVLDEGGEA